MRLHVGPVPDNPDFHPVEEGWRPLREPSAGIFSLVGGGVGILVGAVMAALWALILQREMKFEAHYLAGTGWGEVLLLLATPILGIVLLIVVHELIHAAVHPGFGLS